MSISNNVYPTTRADDERLIRRSYDKFNTGMMSDVDESLVPNSALSNLENMRSTQAGLTGRTGSALFRDVTIPPLSSIAEGSCFLTDETLLLSSPIDMSWVGCKIKTPTGGLYYVSSVDGNTATILPSDTGGNKVPFPASDVYAPINASYADDKLGREFYLIGSKLYTIEDGVNQFVELVVLGGSLISTSSTFIKVNETIMLSNSGGLFAISADNTYCWKHNANLPTSKIRSVSSDSLVNPSVYNYAYGYTKMRDTYNKSRLDTTDVIDLEIPSYYDANSNSEKYYSTIYTEKPIGYNYIKLSRSSVNYYKSPYNWKTGSLGGAKFYIGINFNNNEILVPCDFSNVDDWSDIAASIQKALVASVSYNMGCTAVSNGFLFYSKDLGDDFDFDTTISVSDGTNLIGTAIDYDNETDIKTRAYCHVTPLMYPSYKHVTHYTIYRTADIAPSLIDSINADSRNVNLPEFLSYVDDVPVCAIFSGTLDNWTLTPDNPTDIPAYSLGDSFIYYKNGIKVTAYINGIPDQSGACAVSTDDTFTGVFCIGATEMLRVSKSGNTVQKSVGSFTSDDIGKFIFWKDGTYSVVKGLSSGNAITIDSISKQAEGDGYARCVLDPYRRTYVDFTTDDVLIARSSSLPYNMAFYSPVPNTGIAALSNGVTFFATGNDNVLHYSDSYDSSRVGYYNSGFQINNKITNKITAIFPVNNNIAFTTINKTFTVNVAQSSSGGNPNLGESYTVMPDPQLVSHNIGLFNNASVTSGPSGGVLCITSEPGLRLFNGFEYSEDFSDGYVKRTHLSNLDPNMAVSFDDTYGMNVWGSGE